ncbi:TlpA family protein disulfide reductase [Paracidovorax anthurii]|uniref:Thiol-disulfide isomerase/thioredoxin n=1 Tax=Paracidovorax anthurii TaxID=78229 RepID=A0A328ZLC9_9BURK|nr:TlpA disulfide reductase family protein [Paracidovorax anthurii]RAR85883.1 thiol-disulfide isomerase/thioredoxin [Paracidovorax anthurii]WCM92564.1 TlpA family protein disulfide reductase [Acidovorax sp. NCPPB 2350]
MTTPSPVPTPGTPPQPRQPSRRRALYAGAALAAGAAGAGVAWWRLRPHAVEPGAEAALWSQRFDAPQPGSPALEMQSLRGRKMLVNFWATWCPPCVEELPMLNAFYRSNKEKGWQVVGLAIDQPSSVRQFLARVPLDFPIGLAGLQGTELGRNLGNLTGGLPFTVLLGADGGIRHRKMGQVTAEDLRQWASLA